MNDTASIITDSHKLTVADLIGKAEITRETLINHVKAGLIERGLTRPGLGRKLFWTKTAANKWLGRIGQSDKRFE